MLKNYFKTARKYLYTHKTFSAINLAGLATGMAVCFFAQLYVNFELSYDSYNERADRIYRLVTDVHTSTGVDYRSTTGAMGPAIQEAFPEVLAAARIFLDYLIIQKDVDHFSEERIAYADSTLFSVFTLPLISGNPATVFDAPFNIVLSETAARKYFGSTDCVGETLLVNGKDTATVTGVMQDMPANSHFRVDILFSISTLGSRWMNNWKRFFFYTYLLLPPNYDPARLSAKLPDFIKEHADQSQVKYSLSLEPLRSVYLHSKSRGSRSGSSVHGNINNVYIFALIAAFVLVIACFNFINLTTAFSTQRAKEIGVRKVLGASRRQLIFQFLTDALLLSWLASVLALLLCALLLPLFNQLSGRMVGTTIFQHGMEVGLLLLIGSAIGLVAGLYPAFFLSGFQPVRCLKGRFLDGPQGAGLRKILVIGQFSISIILIVSTIVVYLQLDYMRNQALGFKKDHMVVIDFQFDGRILDHREAIKRQLTDLPGIDLVSFSSAIPGRPNHKYPTKIENVDNDMLDLLADAYYIDYDFLRQYEIEVVAGRAFSKLHAADLKEAMLINETAVKSLGYHNPREALGKRFQQLGKKGQIVGVIKDFHFHSFAEKIQPLTLRVAPGFFTFATLNVASRDLPETIQTLKNKWQELIPGMPLLHFFADEAYNAQYLAEERFGELFVYSATLAILIACLGLLGLTVFTTARRTREIGIRKVLGASVPGIVKLLTKDFLILIMAAFVIGAPVAWIGMNKWLGAFAYRVEISWWVFVASGLTAISVALLTIGFQAIKAAIADPVEALQYE